MDRKTMVIMDNAVPLAPGACVASCLLPFGKVCTWVAAAVVAAACPFSTASLVTAPCASFRWGAAQVRGGSIFLGMTGMAGLVSK